MKSVGIFSGFYRFLTVVVVVRSDGLMTIAGNSGGRQLVGLAQG
jgi:hypothetical protein